jgi:hypothetical protein
MKKLCINCKWKNGIWCDAPRNLVTNPVDGTTTHHWIASCMGQRTGVYTSWLGCRWNGLCGKEGRWFTPKLAELLKR